MTTSVELVEVAARDGLQDLGEFVPTATKVKLIERIAAAGVTRAEVVSFAHPRVIPQMRDAEAVVEATGNLELRRAGLVLNEQGLDRALACGIDEINVVVLATETFSQRNQGMSVDEAVRSWSRISRRAQAAGLPATVTLSAAFGCPYEGRVDPSHVLELAARVAEAGASEVCLADTVGAAVPNATGELVGSLASVTDRCRVHLHDTRGVGLANALAAVAAGVSAIDSSLGGLGGCPFARGARGNLATEDLVWCCEEMGEPLGPDLGSLLGTAEWLAASLPVHVGGHLRAAGPFPSATIR